MHWELQADYGYGHGFECIDCADNYKAIRQSFKTYRENCPGLRLRIKWMKA